MSQRVRVVYGPSICRAYESKLRKLYFLSISRKVESDIGRAVNTVADSQDTLDRELGTRVRGKVHPEE